jgi:hypothetical protein
LLQVFHALAQRRFECDGAQSFCSESAIHCGLLLVAHLAGSCSWSALTVPVAGVECFCAITTSDERTMTMPSSARDFKGRV